MKPRSCLCSILALILLGQAKFVPSFAAGSEGIDLLQRYPTTLSSGDSAPERARSWEFSESDLFGLTSFHFEVGDSLQIEMGPAHLGIGRSADGPVWAVVIPQAEGKLSGLSIPSAETVQHLWLRFHPKKIRQLFPPETVRANGDPKLAPLVRAIAHHRIQSSWQAGGKAMIPPPKDMTVDADVQGGKRRFFTVDTEARKAQYVKAFELRPFKPPPPLTPELAEKVFDQLWEAFDKEYAMFILRPEVDWAKLREQHRPAALQSASAFELAQVCAEMLKPLRDLHIGLTVGSANVPVYDRPRPANANPKAYPRLLGKLQETESGIQWTVTTNQIGFIVIWRWSSPDLGKEFEEVLEQMRDTRGLIIDVRLNGGGSEPLAQEVASRFVDREVIYSYSQFRNGPQHTDLTEKKARKVAPRGPWRYDRPVLVLIGQRSMSSNESFVAMMEQASNVITMGDHTAASSGNPRLLALPLDITARLPRWIDYLADGTPLDKQGIVPRIQFKASADTYEGDRDDLLSAALGRLGSLPLPPQSIPAPQLGPQVIWTSPLQGASEVEVPTELRIRFDRPMDPHFVCLDWEEGGLSSYRPAHYEPDKNEFVIPVNLPGGQSQRLVVNKKWKGMPDQRNGFQSNDHKVARPFTWRFSTKATPLSSQAPQPKLLSVSPPAGSSVPMLVFAEITFDQPMMPPSGSFPHSDGKNPRWDAPDIISCMEYDGGAGCFRLPLICPPGNDQEIAINGFRSGAGIPADPIKLSYRVTKDSFSKEYQERTREMAQTSEYLNLMNRIQQARRGLTSLVEVVDTLVISRKQGMITRMSQQSALFKWQADGKFVADVTGVMGSCDFIVGYDGNQFWWYFKSDQTNFVVTGVPDEMHRRATAFCEPFKHFASSENSDPEHLHPRYAGLKDLEGQKCHVFEQWEASLSRGGYVSGQLTQWWIEAEHFRPVEVRQYYSKGLESRYRFHYQKINLPIPDQEFAPPPGKGFVRKPVDALDADYTDRFLNAMDGSNGRMSVRWGKRGPKGTSSSGLN